MAQNLKTAILLGATGLTGGLLLQKLLADDRYSCIKVFSRSSIGFTHPKLEEHLGDILNLENFKDLFYGDEVYCCIGTTKAKTPDPIRYRAIDFGIPVAAANLAKANGINTFLVVSALGANAKSRIPYNRLKGEMEAAVLQAGFSKTHILQPSLIQGNRGEARRGEDVGNTLMKVLNLMLIGPLKRYRSIQADTIAEALLWLANHSYDKIRVESEEINKIGKNEG